MQNHELPVPRAFLRLMELARGSHAIGSARLYALTWLAVARMAVKGNLTGVTTLSELASEGSWREAETAGIPTEAIGCVISGLSKSGHDLGQRAAAAAIVTELQAELGDQPWDILPCLWMSSHRASSENEAALLPAMCDLLLDLVGTPGMGTLWLPFDHSGQLTLGALRRGWNIRTASLLGMSPTIVQLLLAIETGVPRHDKVDTSINRDPSGRPTTKAECVIATPPFGMPVRGSRMAQWDSSGGSGMEQQYSRSDTWAIHELLNRTELRAVFLIPPGLLFTRGQEQRFREYLLHRGGECNELESVIALPSGVFAATNISAAVLVLNPGRGVDMVRMVDLTSLKRTVSEADQLIAAHRDLALGLEDSPERVKMVSRDEIAANEWSLLPTRYLRKPVDVDETAIPLEQLVTVLRPPATVKDASAVLADEVGIPELERWSPIVGPFKKTVGMRPRAKETPQLSPGDIIFSVKGTVGKAGIMGEVDSSNPVVVSQSCLALRLDGPKAGLVSAAYLLMYLRSKQCELQLRGLQVGSAVQHISPSTLLSSVLIPVLPLVEQQQVAAEYERLCDIEREIAALTVQMTEIINQRWTPAD